MFLTKVLCLPASNFVSIRYHWDNISVIFQFLIYLFAYLFTSFLFSEKNTVKSGLQEYNLKKVFFFLYHFRGKPILFFIIIFRVHSNQKISYFMWGSCIKLASFTRLSVKVCQNWHKRIALHCLTKFMRNIFLANCIHCLCKDYATNSFPPLGNSSTIPVLLAVEAVT